MHNQMYTQNELKQVLKKLIDERQRVKTLEQDYHGERQNSFSSTHSVFENERSENISEYETTIKEKERQINILKDVIRTLGEKLKSEKQGTHLTETSDETHAQLAQLEKTIEETKILLIKAQDKNHALEDEVSRHDKSRNLLLEQLKEQNAKVIEFDALKREYEKSKLKIQELEKTLTFLKQQAHHLSSKTLGDDKIESFHQLEEELTHYKKSLLEKDNALESAHKAHQSQIEFTKAKEQELERELKEARAQYQIIKKELDERSHQNSSKAQLDKDHESTSHTSLEITKELEEMRAKLFRLASSNRDLQSKLDEIAKERACLLGRVKENSLEIERKEKTHDDLAQKIEILQREKSALETSINLKNSELAAQRLSLDELNIYKEKVEELSQELSEKNRAFCHAQEALKTTLHEEQLTKETLIQKLYEKEQNTLQKQEEIESLSQKLHQSEEERKEHQEHLKLLEQHLARRVKECALLSSQVEEYTESLLRASTQNEHHRQKNQELESTIHLVQEQLKEKDIEQAKRLYQKDEEVKEYKSKYESLFTSWEAQGREIQELKALQERYAQIEQLFGKFGQIISTPQQAPQESKPPHYERIQEQEMKETVKSRPTWDSFSSQTPLYYEEKATQSDLLDMKNTAKRNDLFQ